jgi:ClpP class serine protease
MECKAERSHGGKMKKANRVLNAITAGHWAIMPTALKNLYSIANRESKLTAEELTALAMQNAERSPESGFTLRDNVAVIDVSGPIFRHANLFTEISGATSTEALAKSFTKAMNRADVDAILLNIDSPGGEVSGIHELANAIAASRGVKPVYSYVESLGASAAYWLASASEKIYIDATALVGSIGVVSTFKKNEDNTIEIVSTNAPKKKIDPATPEGEENVRSVIDGIAEVFSEDVAKLRGVDIVTVNKKFGEGGVVVGVAAVAAGMADGMSSFEDVIEMLQNVTGGKEMPDDKQTTALSATELREKYPEAIEEIVSETVEKTVSEKLEANAAEATADLSAQINDLKQTILRKDLETLTGKKTSDFLCQFYGKLTNDEITSIGEKFAAYERTIADLGKPGGEPAGDTNIEHNGPTEDEVAAYADKHGVTTATAWTEVYKQKKGV